VGLRILCWNIAEGNDDGRLPNNSALPRIAEQISAQSPDIVLLNEARNMRGPPFSDGVNHVKRIAELTGFSHYHWGNTVRLGWAGFKAVGVLSRFELGTATVHPVMNGTAATTYATLETTFVVDNLVHHVFSTRFDAHNVTDNIAAHQQSIDIIGRLDPSVAVIFGGDFNAEPDTPQMSNFIANSALKDAFLAKPDPEFSGKIIDRIFFRGPYAVGTMEMRAPWVDDEVSDHPWVFVELVNTAPIEPTALQYQENWRWCNRCHALIWGAGGSVCPAGGEHMDQSSNYCLVIDTPAAPGQHDWRWCHKCHALIWGAGESVCPAGGEHTDQGSDYALIYR
jgi:endonuclease/exonuclease/phosphatase family metal-dependent hydrolase